MRKIISTPKRHVARTVGAVSLLTLLTILSGCERQPVSPEEAALAPNKRLTEQVGPLGKTEDLPVLQDQALRRGQSGAVPEEAGPGSVSEAGQVDYCLVFSSNIIKEICDFEPTLEFRAFSRSTDLFHGGPCYLKRMTLLLVAEWKPWNSSRWGHLFTEFLDAMDEWYLEIDRVYSWHDAWDGRSHSEHVFKGWGGDMVTHYHDYGPTRADCVYKAVPSG